MNYKKVFETMISETQSYLEKYNLKTMVLGISGGLDSTVTAAICHEVCKRNPSLNFIGVSLPCSSNTEIENTSALHCMQAFCKEYWTENLQKEYMMMKSTCELHTSSTHISQGNIKARLRMIYLYNLASTNSGIVMDTDNLTEHYLGFFTIHGDVADYNPIGGLWKHEVYKLAQYIREYYNDLYNSENWGGEDPHRLQKMFDALDNAIGITPTDGNGVNDLGDMGQIAPAFAYEKNVDAYTKVDKIISQYLYAMTQFDDEKQNIISTLHNQYGVETVDGIIKRINSTEYKRGRMPIVISRKKYSNNI